MIYNENDAIRNFKENILKMLKSSENEIEMNEVSMSINDVENSQSSLKPESY